MSDSLRRVESDDPRVRAALQEYLELRDRGEQVDRERFLARHAGIAAELRSFLEAEAQLGLLAGDSAGTSAPAQRSAEATTHSVAGRAVDTTPPSQPTGSASSGGLPERFGRYRVLRTLGSGAMGTVYLAEDTQLQRQVALKTSSFDDDPGGDMLVRFYREARSAATLRHNNICPVYDVDQIDGRHFISMAYIEGQPLSAWIKPDKPLSERQTLLIVRKLALALQEAHDHGIIHRDLKPGNVMIDGKGEPIITDFGLARRTQHGDQSRLTQSGMIVGSPAYMSPEQVEAEPDRLTPSTDQYSLGVIVYEMLTGRLPFGGSITAIIGAILTKLPTPPSELRPGLDPRLEALCLKMMAKNPSDRYADLKAAAAEMAAIYKALPAGGGASAAALKPAAAGAGGGAQPASLQTRAAPSQQSAAPQSAGDSTVEENRAAPVAAAKRGIGRIIGEGNGFLRPAVAIGTVAFLLMLGAVTLYLRSGNAVVKVTIHDPDVKVSLQNRTLTIESARDPVKITPGEGTLTISYGGLEFQSEKFTLKKGENPAIEVVLLDDKLAAKFGDQRLGEWGIPSSAEVTAQTESPSPPELPPEPVGEVRRFDGPSLVTGVAFSHDGRQIVSAYGNGEIRLRSTATGRTIDEFSQPPTLRSLACSLRGDRLLTGSTDNHLRLWDVEQGKELHRFEGHRTWVWSVAISPNGRQGLSGDMAGTIRLWDLEEKKRLGLFEGHTGTVRSLVFSPDGRYALSGSDDLNKHQDNSIRLWDVERGTEIRRFENVTSGILGLALDAEGKRALSGCRDNTVRMWDVERGKELLRFDGHTSMVWAVAFLPDGRRAISGGGWDRGDTVVRLWDLERGEELRQFPGHTHDIWSVAVSPDGNYAVSGSSDNTVRLWRLPEPKGDGTTLGPRP